MVGEKTDRMQRLASDCTFLLPNQFSTLTELIPNARHSDLCLCLLGHHECIWSRAPLRWVPWCTKVRVLMYKTELPLMVSPIHRIKK